MSAAAGNVTAKGRRKGGGRAAEAAPVMPAEAAGLPLARILRPQAAYRWLMPGLGAITPQYVEAVLRGALAGNHVQQWELFDLMLDTWPELAACAQELEDGVMERDVIFEPWSDEDEEPTPTAQERCRLVSAALRRMQPDAAADENDLEGTLRDILDGWFRGVAALEVDWQMAASGALGQFIAPRATWWVHPVCFAWDGNGRLGLRVDAGAQMRNLAGGLALGPPAVVGAMPQHKFLIGIHKAKSGSALGGALLRPLAWWWCAANFSADWLLNLAQVFGLPFRWANYEPHAPQATVDAICNMLQNMGSAGWAAFPAGTTLELKEGGRQGSDHSPQGELLDRADRYARLVILGQTMSGSQDASKGGGKAFGAVEADVKARRIAAAAKYVCGVINSQLIPSILMLNYGDADEAPRMRLLDEAEGGLEEAQRDRVLAESGLEIPKSYLRKKYGLPAPRDGEEVVGGGAGGMPAQEGETDEDWLWEDEGEDWEEPGLEDKDEEDGWPQEDGELAGKAAAAVRSFLELSDGELGSALGAAVAAGSREGVTKSWAVRRRLWKRQNAARGLQAVQKLLETRQDVVNAMEVEGLGPVDFRWKVGARGFHHIAGTHKIARRIPLILAYGTVSPIGTTRAAVEHRGHRVILTNNVNGIPSNHWVLTGYRKKNGDR